MTSRILRRGLTLLTGLMLALTGACSAQPAQPPGPESPYAQPSTPQDSLATPVATGGDVDVIAGGLQAAGFFCADVRANATARQIWCRIIEPELTFEDQHHVSTVDIITTPAGQIEYFRVNLPDPPFAHTAAAGGTSWDADTRLTDILNASAFRLWPEDTADVHAAIAAVRDISYWPGQSSHDPRTPRRATEHTKHADYFVGEGTNFASDATLSGNQPLTFVAATDQLTDSWPSSSAHALVTPTAAAPGLEAGGFTCYGPRKRSCHRGNQSIDYTTTANSGDVITVSINIFGGTNPTGSFATLADQGFPHGLSFLTDTVRAGIETRLNQARHDGASFTGIIDGAVISIDTSPPPHPPNHTDAIPVTLTVGAPLVTGVY